MSCSSLPQVDSPARIVQRNYRYINKNKMLVDEFQLFKQSSGNFFKKFQKKTRPRHVDRSVSFDAAEKLRMIDAQKHAQKTKKSHSRAKVKVKGLCKRESDVFFAWFTDRMLKYQRPGHSGDANEEIPIQYVIDDFIETGLFSVRAEAFEFLKFVDKDRNGSVSVEEFSNVFRDIDDAEHISTMKSFISLLEESGDYSNENSLPRIAINRRKTAQSGMKQNLRRCHSLEEPKSRLISRQSSCF